MESVGPALALAGRCAKEADGCESVDDADAEDSDNEKDADEEWLASSSLSESLILVWNHGVLYYSHGWI